MWRHFDSAVTYVEMVDDKEKAESCYVGDANVSFRMKPMMSPMSPTIAANFKDNPFSLFLWFLRLFTFSCNVIINMFGKDPLFLSTEFVHMILSKWHWLINARISRRSLRKRTNSCCNCCVCLTAASRSSFSRCIVWSYILMVEKWEWGLKQDKN